MNPYITHLSYKVDKERLLKIANEKRIQQDGGVYKPTREEFSYLKKDVSVVEFIDDEYATQIINDLQLIGMCIPKMGWLKPHAHLTEHVDYETLASINFLLSDDPAPVTCSNIDHYYTAAVLNTQAPHAVKNGDTERILFRIAILEETYESLVARIPYKIED